MENNVLINALLLGYREGSVTPEVVVKQIQEAIKNYEDYNIWTYCLNEQEIKPYLERLKDCSIDELPLYGIPFAIKDNIDLKGIPTTAGCESFARIPEKSATVVDLLIKAGAIPIGKTNLDQFATGLVGTRSPEKWGACRNAFNKDYISGGSSAGSGLAVSLGLVSFSLGTDTAGSGRIPAALNNIVGLKPSKGLISTHGVVPACRSLDCVSIFASTPHDVAKVFDVVSVPDSKDEYSRHFPFAINHQIFGNLKDMPVIGVLAKNQMETFGDEDTINQYEAAVATLQKFGVRTKVIDFTAFISAAKLLYEGPWVAERYIATSDYLNDMLDVTKTIISQGANYNAIDAFNSEYLLKKYKVAADIELNYVDMIITPSAPGHYSLAEIESEPIKKNSQLGYYTNFMNLLDYSAVAVPSSFNNVGLPFGVTFFADKFQDKNLLSFAQYYQKNSGLTLGATHTIFPEYALEKGNNGRVNIVVCGAHLNGFPLNWQLTERGGFLVKKTKTAACYRFYALAGGPPHRPGLIRDVSGDSIDVEVWSLPVEYLGSFVANIPVPLGIGKIELIDNSWETSFICESYAIPEALDITHLKSWESYIDGLNN
ncbi:allophanate hydrolase [Maribacter antarcticus]|uniref:allophanate hydrolase n=1 Tax=Maribacter antarcticus TaxID=505250 RepID=UPI00047A66E5|nr:allophanate hydrolase [Maribacter antarcticus]